MQTERTQKPYIKYLTESQIERINLNSLDLLEKTGIEVDHPAGLEALDVAGASVDYGQRRARIPRHLVAQCLETVPKAITLAARNPARDCHLTYGNRPYSRNGGGADFTIDQATGEFRKMLHADVIDYFKLMDALDGISFIAPVFGQDMPVIGRDILMLLEAFNNTDKHIHLRAFTGESLRYMFEMAALVAGGKQELKKRPLVSLLEAPISPLKFLDVTVDALWQCGEFGIPLDVCVMPIAGGTGPMTMAGNLQLLNTEFLAGVVISQLANPGAPLQYAPRPMAMDMRTGFSLAGSVELGMMAAAGAQLAHFYGVPVSLHGPWTDSMTHDAQSILERTYMNTMAAMAGANVLVGAGMMQQSLVTSHEAMVIDSEINRIAFHAAEGFELDDDRLALEVIEAVGPGGNFVADMHTYKYLRTERYVPEILCRDPREVWEGAGSKTMLQVAREKADAILAEHTPTPLPEDIGKELNALAKQAIAALAG